MEIKVKPEDLLNDSQNIRSTVDSLNVPVITKDEETNVTGNTKAHENIDKIAEMTTSLQQAMSTFCDNLNTMANTLKEADENA